jgi:hypothetical protein
MEAGKERLICEEHNLLRENARRSQMLRCQILGGAIHGDLIVVRTFAGNAQQNRDRKA